VCSQVTPAIQACNGKSLGSTHRPRTSKQGIHVSGMPEEHAKSIENEGQAHNCKRL